MSKEMVKRRFKNTTSIKGSTHYPIDKTEFDFSERKPLVGTKSICYSLPAILLFEDVLRSRLHLNFASFDECKTVQVDR